MIELVASIARRPGLWPQAARTAIRLVPSRWWARAPFLPVPRKEYLRFRLLTQYGRTDHPLVADDVLNYLAWCRDNRR